MLRKIMIVDDEEHIVALVREVLSRDGYCITTASTLGSARKLLKSESESLGLLITDLTLPDGDGAELAVELLMQNASLNVLLITGWTDAILSLPQELRSRAFLIEKPFSIEELKRVVHAMLPLRKDGLVT